MGNRTDMSGEYKELHGWGNKGGEGATKRDRADEGKVREEERKKGAERLMDKKTLEERTLTSKKLTNTDTARRDGSVEKE